MAQPNEVHECDRNCERFAVRSRTWCTTYALELIEHDPTAVAEFDPVVDITELDVLIGREPLRAAVEFPDVNYATADAIRDSMTVDLDRPLVVVDVLDEATGKSAGRWVIHGWPQVIRAREEGRTTLPANLLTDTAERACRDREVWV